MGRKKKTTFVFDLEWHDAIQELETAEEQVEAYRAICHYARYGEFPKQMSATLRMALKLIGFKIADNKRAYDEKCENMSRAAKQRESEKAQLAQRFAESAEKAQSAQDDSESTEKAQLSQHDSESTEKAQLSQHDSECTEKAQLSQLCTGSAEKAQLSQIGSEGDSDSEYDKYFSLPPGGAHDAYVRERLMAAFFDKPITTDSFIKRWETNLTELREMCESVLDEWTLSGMTHHSQDDAVKHFVTAVRTRYENKIRQKQNAKSSKGGRPAGSSGSGPQRNALDRQGDFGYGLDD